MKKLYQLLLDRWNQKTDTVLVTIVEGNGSVPRTTGAYMVVAKNGRIWEPEKTANWAWSVEAE